MDYYIDIKLLPDPEFCTPMLMNALFSKLHRALVEVSVNDIGISFPGFGKTSLGDTLRLHGTQTKLAELEAMPWRKGLGDYTKVTDLLVAPATTEFVLVKRVRVQSSAERLRRRAMKRKGITHEQAMEQIPDSVEKFIKDRPFVRIKSQSTGGQQFRLFVEQTKVDGPMPTQLEFSKYGLSATTPVPKF